MKIMEYLDKLWDEVADWFEDIGEEIVGVLKPLARQIKKAGGPILLAAALEAVKAAEAAGGSGSSKREAAKDAIVATLKGQGIPIVMNAVYGAIEIAVAKLRED